MYKKALCVIMCSVLVLHAQRRPVDRVQVVIYGETDTIMITQSEVERPSLDGQPKTLDDLVFENLVYLDAKRIGAIPSQEEVDRHWESVKQQNNLSENDMQNIATQAGYTLFEAKAQLGKMSSISQMYDFKVKSGLFVGKQDVEAYYHAHPEVQQAEYHVARAVVPFSDLEPKDQLHQRIQEFVTTGKGNMRLAWQEPFWLTQDEIAADKQFICKMSPGDIWGPYEAPYGFELIKLVDKKPECRVSLDERYDEIAMTLKRPKYELLLQKYKDELYDKATIVYF